LRARRRRGEAGFSLIEVVVALALLGLVLAVLIDSVRSGLGSASRAAALAPPLALAEAKLAAVGITAPLAPGDTSGQDASGIGWRVSVDDYRDDGFAGPSADAPGVPKLYRVRVTATWQQGGAPRSLSLESLRLETPRRP
jgi:prepilin-type N-terminal cleavage/methylation domain-containing protein